VNPGTREINLLNQEIYLFWNAKGGTNEYGRDG